METVEIEYEGTYFTIETINSEPSRVTTNGDLKPFLKIQDYSNIKKLARNKIEEDLTAEYND